MRCDLDVFYGRFRRISVIRCISVFLVTANKPYSTYDYERISINIEPQYELHRYHLEKMPYG